MNIGRLLAVAGIGVVAWMVVSCGPTQTRTRQQQVRQESSRDVIVGVLRLAPAGLGAHSYLLVTPQGRHIPIRTRQGERFLNRDVRMTVEYIGGGPQFRIVGMESRLSPTPTTPPATPRAPAPREVTPERPNPVVLVRASEERINERVRGTRQQIEDKQMLARRLEDRLERLPRTDPDVRRDHIEEIRDVRRGALADISRELKELPRQIAGWRG
jgi:hypothetical protein